MVLDKTGNVLEPKLTLKSRVEHLFSPVPKWVNWSYSFGGIAFLLFILQLISGIYLTFFYIPTAQEAWKSISNIENMIFMGHFFRSLHRWSAFMLVIFVIAHAVRVFLFKAYRGPRRGLWWIGEGLLILTLGFVVTGYLLPWDVRAYWEVLSIRNSALNIPLLGQWINGYLLSSGLNDQIPVFRYFATHVVILPLLICVGLISHFALIRRLGVAPREGRKLK